MKNKRNTRRGRAKRWEFCGPTHIGQWHIRGSSTWAYAYDDESGWFTVDVRDPADERRFPSRAVAMRAAEHLARQ